MGKTIDKYLVCRPLHSPNTRLVTMAAAMMDPGPSLMLPFCIRVCARADNLSVVCVARARYGCMDA